MNQTNTTLVMGYNDISKVAAELAQSGEKRKVERGISQIRDRFKYLGNLVAKPNDLRHRIAMLEMSLYSKKFQDYKALCDAADLGWLEEAVICPEVESIEFLIIDRDKQNNINHVAVDISMTVPLAQMTVAQRKRFMSYISSVFIVLSEVEQTCM